MSDEYIRRSLRRPVEQDLPQVDAEVTKKDRQDALVRGITATQGSFTKGRTKTAWEDVAGKEFITAGKKRAAGDESWRKHKEQGRALSERGSAFNIKQSDLRNLRSVGDAAKFAMFHTGSEFDSYAQSILGGASMTAGGLLTATGVGAPIGVPLTAAGASLVGGQAAEDYRRSLGSRLGEQYADAGSEGADPNNALLAARISAGAEAAGSLIPMSVGKRFGRGAGDIVGDAVSGELTRSAAKKTVAGAAARGAKGVLTEGTEEAGQEVLAHILNKSLANKQADLDPWAVANAFAAGGAVHGTFAGGMAGATKALETAAGVASRAVRGSENEDPGSTGPAPEGPAPEGPAPEGTPPEGTPLDGGPAPLGPDSPNSPEQGRRAPVDLGPDNDGARAWVEDKVDNLVGGVRDAFDNTVSRAKQRVDDLVAGAKSSYDAGAETARKPFDSVATRWSDLSTGFKDRFGSSEDVSDAPAKPSPRERAAAAMDRAQVPMQELATARDQLGEALHSAKTELREYLGDSADSVIESLSSTLERVERAMSFGPKEGESRPADRAGQALQSVRSEVGKLEAPQEVSEEISNRFETISNTLGNAGKHIRNAAAYLEKKVQDGVIPPDAAKTLSDRLKEFASLDKGTANERKQGEAATLIDRIRREMPDIKEKVGKILPSIGDSRVGDHITERFEALSANLGKAGKDLSDLKDYVAGVMEAGLIPAGTGDVIMEQISRLTKLNAAREGQGGRTYEGVYERVDAVDEAVGALRLLSQADDSPIKALDRAAKEHAAKKRDESVAEWEFKWDGADYALGSEGLHRKVSAVGDAVGSLQEVGASDSEVLGSVFGGGRIYGAAESLRQGLDDPALAGNSPQETAQNIQNAVEQNVKNAIEVRDAILQDESAPTSIKEMLMQLDPTITSDQQMIAETYDKLYRMQDVLSVLTTVESLYGPAAEEKMSLVGAESLTPELIDSVAEALGPEHAAAAPDIATRLARAVTFLSDKELAQELFTSDLRNTFVDILAASGSNESFLAQMFVAAGQPVPSDPRARVEISRAVRDAAVSRQTGNRLADGTQKVLDSLQESIGADRLDAAIDYYVAVDRSDDALTTQSDAAKAATDALIQSVKNTFVDALEGFDTDGRIKFQLAKYGDLDAIESHLPADKASAVSASAAMAQFRQNPESVPFFVTAARHSLKGMPAKDQMRIVTELASYIDRTSMNYALMSDVQKDNAVRPLVVAFGSRDKAEAVLAYYGIHQRMVAEFMADKIAESDVAQTDALFDDNNVVAPEYTPEGAADQNSSDVDLENPSDIQDEYGGLNEKDATDLKDVAVSYKPRSRMRPYLRSDKKSAAEAAEMAEMYGGEARIVPYGQVFEAQMEASQDPEAKRRAPVVAIRREVGRISRELKRLMEDHMGRDRASQEALRDELRAMSRDRDGQALLTATEKKLAGTSLEDRSAPIEALRSEIQLLDATFKAAMKEYKRSGSPEALYRALDMYDVVVSPKDALVATDRDLQKYRGSIDKQGKDGKFVPEIRINFKRSTGTTYPVRFSPIAMVAGSAVKGSTHAQLSDTLARIAARPDFAGFDKSMAADTDLGFKRPDGKGNYTWGEFVTSIPGASDKAAQAMSSPKKKNEINIPESQRAAFEAEKASLKEAGRKAFDEAKQSVFSEAVSDVIASTRGMTAEELEKYFDKGVLNQHVEDATPERITSALQELDGKDMDSIMDSDVSDLARALALQAITKFGVRAQDVRSKISAKIARDKKSVTSAEWDMYSQSGVDLKAASSLARNLIRDLVPEPEWTIRDPDTGAGYYTELHGLAESDPGVETNSYLQVASQEVKLEVLEERARHLQDLGFSYAATALRHNIRVARESADRMIASLPVWERHHDRASIIPQAGEKKKDAWVLQDTRGDDVAMSKAIGIPNIMSKAARFFAPKNLVDENGMVQPKDITAADILLVAAAAPKILAVMSAQENLSKANQKIKAGLERLVQEGVAGKNTHPKALVDVINESRFTGELARSKRGELYREAIKALRASNERVGTVEPKRVIDLGHAHRLLTGQTLSPGRIISAAQAIPSMIKALSSVREHLSDFELQLLERAENFTKSRDEYSLYESINRAGNLSKESRRQLWVMARDAYREASGMKVRDTKLSGEQLKARRSLIEAMNTEARQLKPVEIVKQSREQMEALALGKPDSGKDMTLEQLVDTARRLRQYVYNVAAGDTQYSVEVRDQIHKMFARGNAKLIEQKLKDMGYPGNKREGSRAIREALGFVVTRQQKEAEDLAATAAETEKMSRDTSRRPLTPDEAEALKAELTAEISRMRGSEVEVAFDTLANLGGSGSFRLNRDSGRRLISLALDAANPMGTARHEAFHDFFGEMGASREIRSLRNRMKRHVNTPAKRRAMAAYMRERGINEEAIQQLKDPEEMLAYYFQFWSEDPTFLEGARPEPNSALGKIFTAILDVFRAVGNVARTLTGMKREETKIHEVLGLLRDGQVQDTAQLDAALVDRKLLSIMDNLDHMTGGVIGYKGVRTLFPAAAYLKDHGSVGVNNILRMFNPEFVDEGGDPGFVKSKMMQTSRWLNQAEDILEGATPEELRALGQEMYSMRPATSERGIRLRALLKDMFVMQRDAGVMRFDRESSSWVPIREVKNYGVRKWDPAAVSRNPEGFVEVFTPYIGREQAVLARDAILHGDGQIEQADGPGHVGYTPFHASLNARQFTFITADNVAEFAPFMDSDIVEVMNTYITQAVHRAEYAKYFGNDGQRIRENLDIAIGEGLSDKEVASVMNAVHSMQGTLDHPDVGKRWKTFTAVAVTAQNVAILPLIIFSSLPDALGVAARTGDMKHAGKTLLKGLDQIQRDIRKLPPTAQERFARRAGIIARDNLLDAMGASSHSMNMSPRVRKLNSKFFALTGIVSLTKGMRIAAMGVGMDYLVEKKDDAEFLKTLGLTADDIIVNSDGDLIVDKTELINHWVASTEGPVDANAFDARAQELSQKLSSALYQFVDSSIVRPNASHRPAWASDPRFQIFAYLKQYTWSFRQVVLERAKHEMLGRDNFAPLAPLLLYAPFMFIADVLRGSIFNTVQGNFTSAEYMMGSLARSGILGVGSFGLDAYVSAQRHGGGVLSAAAGALGPIVEHGVLAADTLVADGSSQRLAERSMPFGTIVGGLRRRLEDD